MSKSTKIKQQQEPIAEFEAWLAKNGLSPYEAARRMGMAYSVLKRVLAGETTNARTLAKFYFASNGELTLERMLPAGVRAELRKRYRGVLVRRTPAPRPLRARPRGPRTPDAQAGAR